MKIYPTVFEILDEGEKDIIARFKAFDGDGFEIDLEMKFITPEDLRELADHLETAEKLLKKGV